MKRNFALLSRRLLQMAVTGNIGNSGVELETGKVAG